MLCSGNSILFLALPCLFSSLLSTYLASLSPISSLSLSLSLSLSHCLNTQAETILSGNSGNRIQRPLSPPSYLLSSSLPLLSTSLLYPISFAPSSSSHSSPQLIIVSRQSVLLGETTLSRTEIQEIINQLAVDYVGNGYHPFTRNCNSFSNDLSLKLFNKPIPSYINRLPYLGMSKKGRW